MPVPYYQGETRVSTSQVSQIRCSRHASLNAGSDVTLFGTLRTPLSGTFLQTLPDLVTPLKGYSLKGSGTNMTVEAT